MQIPKRHEPFAHCMTENITLDEMDKEATKNVRLVEVMTDNKNTKYSNYYNSAERHKKPYS